MFTFFLIRFVGIDVSAATGESKNTLFNFLYSKKSKAILIQVNNVVTERAGISKQKSRIVIFTVIGK
jgi:ABC-type sulfate transport system substrate-binding protein